MKKKQVEKFCPVCEKYLPIDSFYYVYTTKQYGGCCKECDKERKRKWYIQNKEAVDKKRKEWQEENYERHLIHQNKYNKSVKGKATRQRYRDRFMPIRESAQQ